MSREEEWAQRAGFLRKSHRPPAWTRRDEWFLLTLTQTGNRWTFVARSLWQHEDRPALEISCFLTHVDDADGWNILSATIERLQEVVFTAMTAARRGDEVDPT